jgi:hypothetical protein
MTMTHLPAESWSMLYCAPKCQRDVEREQIVEKSFFLKNLPIVFCVKFLPTSLVKITFFAHFSHTKEEVSKNLEDDFVNMSLVKCREKKRRRRERNIELHDLEKQTYAWFLLLDFMGSIIPQIYLWKCSTGHLKLIKIV